MTTRTSLSRPFSRTLLGVALPMLLVAATASAQSTKGDPRWEAWIGCWQSMAQATSTAPATDVVCVTPLSSGSAVEVATLSKGKVIGRDTIDASGEKHAIATQGCTGWQRADWSHDTRRVYLASEVTCGSAVARTSTGVIAMTPGGDWLDIQSASASGNSGVRAIRYREVGPWFADLPPEFQSVASTRGRLPYAARALAGSEVGPRDVIEAVTRLDSLVVETWLAERGQQFDLDARALVKLADAGVPGSITDIMIGVSFPSRFAVSHTGVDAANVGTEVRPTYSGYGVSNSRQRAARCVDAFDPMWYPQSAYDSCYGYGYSGYGYSPYGYGAYGYSPYGYGYPSYGYTGPVVIVRGNGKDEPPHGKVVNGSGYTRRGDDGSSGDTQQQSSGSRGSTQSSGSSGRSSGSSSSGSSSSGSSSSGSSSSGRTAQARKGGG